MVQRRKKNPHILTRQVRFRSGREGPSHDPYGWEEVVVTIHKKRGKKKTFVLREGALGYTRLKVNGNTVRECAYGEKKKEQQIHKYFEKLTGLDSKALTKAYNRWYKGDGDPMGPASRYE